MRQILTPAVALMALAACAKPAAQTTAQITANPADQAASSNAAVHWDMASSDPARNPAVANQEASVPGYNP